MGIDQGLVWVAISTLFAAFVAFAMGLFSRKNQMPVEGKTVLLTGASEGMGRSIAIKLSAKGADIIAVARNTVRLEELFVDLKAAAKNPSTQRFTYFTGDVSVEDYAPPLVEAATTWNNGRAPDICWCVAGMATPGFFAETPFSVLRRNTAVNFFGTAEMAHTILRAWLAPAPAPSVGAESENAGANPDGDTDNVNTNAGTDACSTPRHLIITSSVTALFPVAGYSPYAPSKTALRGLADTLAHELLLYPDANVRIHILYPGTMTSPGFDKENETKPEITRMIEEPDPIQTPEQAADVAFDGLERGHYSVAFSWLGHAFRWSSLAASARNNWLVDTFMAALGPFFLLFALFEVLGKEKGYTKKYRHPCEHPKPGSSK